jgi:hypothetical protein
VIVTRRRVIIESPFAAGNKADADRNLRYAHEAMVNSILRGEAPFASHLLYTQVLDDHKPEQRAWGMDCGFAWLPQAEAVVVYIDLGISSGMAEGMKRAEQAGLNVEFRELPGWGAEVIP